MTDITEGNLANIAAGGTPDTGVYLAGLLVYRDSVNGDKLIGTAENSFDAGNTAKLSHFFSNLVWNNGTTVGFNGMYKVGTLNPAFVGGWMTNVPSDLQTLLGGPALTGQGGLSIISRTSAGPAAFAFDPADLGKNNLGTELNPVADVPLVYYPEAHQTVGPYGGQGVGYHEGVMMGGMTMLDGTRTVLFFSTSGIGPSSYGGGSPDPIFADECKAPDVCITPANCLSYSTPSYDACNAARGYSICADVNNCTTGMKALPYPPGFPGAGLGVIYDPVNGTEGPHAYPYINQIWAYDANDLAAAKNAHQVTSDDFNSCRFQTDATTNPPTCLAVGQTVQPWNVVPYAKFPMPLLAAPTGLTSRVTATWDSVHDILYVVEPGVDHTGCCTDTPIIHAFSIDLGASVAQSYAIKPTVILLNGSLTLQNNGGDDLTVSANDRKAIQSATFNAKLAPGSSYDVTISSQPDGQICSVLNGSGKVDANEDVSSVVVTCTGAGVVSSDVLAPAAPSGLSVQ